MDREVNRWRRAVQRRYADRNIAILRTEATLTVKQESEKAISP